MELFFKKLGDGLPLIILHGLYGSSDNWLTIGKSLADQYTIYIPDQRNHGKSSHSRTHSYPVLRDDLLEFMDKHNIQKATIMGHSMGGKTAIFFAIKYPERVENLIVVDISPRSYMSLEQLEHQPIDHMNIINAMINVDFDKVENRSDVERILANGIKELQIRQFLLKNLVRGEDQKFRWRLNIETIRNQLPNIMAGLTEQDKNENTKNLSCLFINGDRSDYLPEKDYDLIKTYFPKAEFATIFDAGHWLHADQTENFLNVVKYFLKEKN